MKKSTKAKKKDIFYQIGPKGNTRKISGEELLVQLNEREERGVQGCFFTVWAEGLPAYVWDNLYISAEDAFSDSFVKYKDVSLRKFLEYDPYRYFSEKHENKYADCVNTVIKTELPTV